MRHDKGSGASSRGARLLTPDVHPLFRLVNTPLAREKSRAPQNELRAEVTREKGMSFTNLFYREGVNGSRGRRLGELHHRECWHDLPPSGNLYREYVKRVFLFLLLNASRATIFLSRAEILVGIRNEGCFHSNVCPRIERLLPDFPSISLLLRRAEGMY